MIKRTLVTQHHEGGTGILPVIARNDGRDARATWLKQRVVATMMMTMTCALAGCPADPRESAKSHVVAKVGDEIISEAELLSSLAQHGSARIAEGAARNEVARLILDELVTEHLMLQAAAKAGITVRDEDVDREVRSRAEGYPVGTFQRLLVAEQLTLSEFKEKVRRRLVQDAFLRARLAQEPRISEDEVKARFDATFKDAKVQEQVRARQILVKTAEEAMHILDQVRTKKIGFEAAAAKYSTSPDAETGGDLGWFTRGEMPEVFDVCFNLDKGTISDVVISDYGFHIFQIVDRRDAHQESFESARDKLEEEIVREHQDAAYVKLMAELRQETKVVVTESGIDRVVSLLPAPPATPNEKRTDGDARSLDSLPTAIDPVPPLPGKEIRE